MSIKNKKPFAIPVTIRTKKEQTNRASTVISAQSQKRKLKNHKNSKTIKSAGKLKTTPK
jgi:hypothetical protein